MRTRIIASGELADEGGSWRVEVTQLNIFQAIIFWWQCKFGRYKNHYCEIRDKDGNKIEVYPLSSFRRK